MFNKIFNPDNFFFRGCNKIWDTALLSLLWLALCIPVITIGPATAALYYTTVKCIRHGEAYPYRNFFRCFRSNFKIGALASLFLTVLCVLLFAEYEMLVSVASTGYQPAVAMYYAFCVVLLLAAGIVSYLFPILSRFNCTFGGLFLRAVQLALCHLPSTVVLALLNTQAFQFCLRYGYPYVLPLLFTPVLTALLSSLFLERILKQYTAESVKEGETPPWYLK